MEKTMMKQVAPCKSMKDHTGEDIRTTAHEGPHTAAGVCALKETSAHGEPMQEQAFWQELCPIGDPHWSSMFLKDCTLWKRAILEQFLKNCSLWGGV
ncbi:hypothetical protein llap_5264 [Limosa lapponica baueri]|uniref:Uncharacterized protein n=1 Tax=Limosa lapponica baueri TaxID=1758121 RepID=A0A2I0UEF1_LIMLA|nr:hypothetical protein llap_5264 [Limosa lapponica baueri]